ncbi:PAS domain-containing protein [Caulobacter segnis]
MPDATAANGVGGGAGHGRRNLAVRRRPANPAHHPGALRDGARGRRRCWGLGVGPQGQQGPMPTPATPNCTTSRPRSSPRPGLPVQSFTPAVHPDDAEGVRAVALRAAKDGADFSHEYRLIQADGSVRWVYTRGRVYVDEDGQPYRNTGVIIDITERKQVEGRSGRRARQDLDMAAQAAGLGRWDHKPHLGQRYWDAHARRSLRPARPTNPPPRRRSRRLLHPDDVASVRAAVIAATDPAGGAPLNMEYRIHRHGGRRLRWVETFGRGLLRGRPVSVRFVGAVVSDVTERREAIDTVAAPGRDPAAWRSTRADVGTRDFNIDTGELTWSDRCYAMLGVKIGEPVGVGTASKPASIRRPGSRRGGHETWPRIRRSAPTHAVEFRVIGRDDHVERWV